MAESQAVTPGGKGKKCWEHVWEADEMRNKACDWSLAGDAGLLLQLQNFSQDLLAKTHNIQEQLNLMNQEAKLTCVRLNNVFNDFIMLANTQFVENRVYDEDVAVDKPSQTTDSQEKMQDQREAELIPRITEAISLGLYVIDSAYEKLDLNAANSSDEDEENFQNKLEVLLEPKDPYINRPLPHLIGSVNFMHDENLGLLDESDEEQVEKHTVESSESETRSEAEEEERVLKHHPQVPSDAWSRSESESSGDIFYEKEDNISEDESLFEKKLNDAASDIDEEVLDNEPNNFINELNKKLNPSTIRQSQAKLCTGSPSKSTKVRTFADVKDVFGDVHRDEPVTDCSDDDNTFFSAESGQFATGGSLFDDDNNCKLFGAAKSPPLTAQGSLSAKSDKPVKKTVALFAGDSESEDDKKLHKQSLQPKKKVLAGAVSMFGPSGNPMLQATKKQLRSKSSTDESDTESETASHAGSQPGTGTSSSIVITADVAKISTRKKQGIQVIPTSIKSEAPGLTKMFDKISVVDRKTEKPKPSGGLFDNDDDDDDLFTSLSHKSSTKQQITTSKESGLSSGGVFLNDDDDDDLFSSISKSSKAMATTPMSTTASNTKVLSLFDDDVDPGDIFSRLSTAKPAVAHPSSVKTEHKPQARSLSVFDDDELFGSSTASEPAVDLFGTDSPLVTPSKNVDAEKSQKRKTSTSKSKSTYLFMEKDNDDNFLFAPKAEVAVPKDPFQDSPTKGKTKDSFQDKPTEMKKENQTAASLFSNEEEDIFSTISIISTKSEIPATDSSIKPCSVLVKNNPEPVSLPEAYSTSDMFATNNVVSHKGARSKESVSSPKTSETSSPRRPVAGISMFGGMHSSAFLQNKQGTPVGATNEVIESDQEMEPSGMIKTISADVSRAIDVVGFDQPIFAPVLQSATKARAKISYLRKRPTRQSFQFGAASNNSMTSGTLSETSMFSHSSTDILYTVENGNNNSNSVIETYLKSISDISTSQKVEKVIELKDSLHSLNNEEVLLNIDDDIGDIFGDYFDTKPKTKLNLHKKPECMDKSVLKTETSVGKSPLLEQIPETITPAESHITNIGKNDIFANTILSKGTTKNVGTRETVDLFEDSKQGSIFDDDIFSRKPRTVKRAVTPKVLTFESEKKVAADDANIFTTNLSHADEDVFSSDSNKKKRPAETSESASEDIFQDDADILSDVLPSTKSSMTKKTKPAKMMPSIFNDDDDDLFASSPMTNKTKTKPAKISTKSPVVDIFADDSPSIFDDPLAARKK